MYADAEVEYVLETSLGHRDQRREAFQTAGIVGVAAFFGALVAHVCLKKPWTSAVIGELAVLALVVMAASLLINSLGVEARHRRESLKDIDAHPDLLGETSVALLPEGFSVHWPKGYIHVSWSKVGTVLETSSFVMVFLFNILVAVPKSAFESVEQKDTFFREARERCVTGSDTADPALP